MNKIIVTILFLMLSIILLPKNAWAYSKDEVLSAVTVVRSDYYQKSLTENQKLNIAAEAKLADIQKYKYWAHNNPSTGKEWIYFIRQARFNGSAGENLAKGFNSAEKIIDAWLKSPSHKKNLLSGKFDSVGIAIGEVTYKTGPETVVVLTFGKQQKMVSFWEELFPNRKIVSL